MGTLQRIWLKRAKRGPMDSAPAASLEPGVGLIGNANIGGLRQVTIIARERWAEIMTTIGSDLDPSTGGAGRANPGGSHR